MSVAGWSDWKFKCSLPGMAENFLDRLQKIAADALPGESRVESVGESYYTFEMTDANGTKSTLPRIWIDRDASDAHIRSKLAFVLQGATDPDSLPDDASVPNIQTEGQHR